jgi:hypothetical protein
MPDHFHGIVLLDRARQASPLHLGVVVGALKACSSREAGTRLWQRGYHGRVIRDERELDALRRYVLENPLRSALQRPLDV